jgi:hypothetical protein
MCNCNVNEVRNVYKSFVRSCEYYVNEQKRTVTAVLTNASLDAVKRVSKEYGGKAVGLDITGTMIDEEALNALLISDKFVATARCSAEDTFDVEEGKRIACRRVYAKYDAAREKAWKRYAKVLQDRTDAVNACLEKFVN